MYMFLESCLPSPCINNGMCIAVNATDQMQCNCREMYYGIFCENTDNVCTHTCVSIYVIYIIMHRQALMY